MRTLIVCTLAGLLAFPRQRSRCRRSRRRRRRRRRADTRQAELYAPAVGCHSTFDRFVVRARFANPRYDVRYVRQIVQDGSGNPVSLLGSYRLRVLFRDARGHTSNGTTDLIPNL